MTKYRPQEWCLSATCATFVVYFGVLGLWVLAFCTDRQSPTSAPRVVQAVLASAPTLAGDPASKWSLDSLRWNAASRSYELRLVEDGTTNTMRVVVDGGSGTITEMIRPAP
jgi:hypothetical protein